MLLTGSAGAAIWLHRWRDLHPVADARREAESADDDERHHPLGGNPFAGAREVFKSPFLIGIAVFVLLLSSITTFLYFEQARLVAETFPDRTRQTQVFGPIDSVVQALSILTQIFFTGHIARKLGIGFLLAAVPVVLAAGFLWLAMAPVFAVLVVVIIVRRAGEYALVRPGREMLFTSVSPEQKYKAKNFIDTVIYRGGDAISGWVKRGLDLFADHPATAMLIGAAVALLWAGVGAGLGRRQSRIAAAREGTQVYRLHRVPQMDFRHR